MSGGGVVAEIFVGDEAHGVAEIEFGDVMGAVGGEDEINTERALVERYNVELNPRFKMGTERMGKVDATGNVVIVEEDVVVIDSTGGFEERIADKMEIMVGYAVFKGVGSLDLPARFDDDTTLLTDNFLKPKLVVVGERA